VTALARGIVSGDRRSLARGITLVESARVQDRALARNLLDSVALHTGKAQRIGFSGVPGAGKSTLIDAFGNYALELGKRVAVLAVDPSSDISGGSILGDKTRMARLAASERAFIRPSPSGGTLGGASLRTPDAILLCEAAGHDLVLVETVGVGQAEHAVASMVDTFVLVLIAGAGDELQGLKRGVLEFADIVVINKADGDNVMAAERAAAELQNALGVLRARRMPVLTTSATQDHGILELWRAISEHHASLESSGKLAEKRREQLKTAWRRAVEESLWQTFFTEPSVKVRYAELEARVMNGELTPSAAAVELFKLLKTS
jgi:LAO/AO transport system kinase